jgi:hypothetical protein
MILPILYKIAPQYASNASFIPREKIAQEPPARLFGLALGQTIVFILLYEIAPQNALNESFMPREKIAQEPQARLFGLALE